MPCLCIQIIYVLLWPGNLIVIVNVLPSYHLHNTGYCENMGLVCVNLRSELSINCLHTRKLRLEKIDRQLGKNTELSAHHDREIAYLPTFPSQVCQVVRQTAVHL